MVDSGHRAGRLQEPVLFLFRVMAVEKVHGDRLIREDCGPELAAVDARMEEIRAEHGLEDGAYWPLGEGPIEWEELNTEHDAICERLFVETLREFGLVAEAALRQTDRQEFERRRELGRRAIVEGLPDVELLDNIREQFAREARASAKGGAYHAASAMIGGAMEAVLLARCLRVKDEAVLAAQALSIT